MVIFLLKEERPIKNAFFLLEEGQDFTQKTKMIGFETLICVGRVMNSTPPKFLPFC